MLKINANDGHSFGRAEVVTKLYQSLASPLWPGACVFAICPSARSSIMYCDLKRALGWLPVSRPFISRALETMSQSCSARRFVLLMSNDLTKEARCKNDSAHNACSLDGWQINVPRNMRTHSAFARNLSVSQQRKHNYRKCHRLLFLVTNAM